jgi:2-polyprenyl-3-methyl-5-hydroxy-6-metoxy-1,4-benzoquinol methylase
VTSDSKISYYQHSRPELVAEIDLPVGRLLDVGCGAGFISSAIRSQCSPQEIWGVEVVPEVAEQARQNPALDQVFSGDIANIISELPKASFSHIVAGDVLEHLVDPWSVLESLRHCLEPGGKFICSIPNIRNFSFILDLLFRRRFRYRESGVMDRTHLRFFTRIEIEIMFRDAGYSAIQIGPVRPKNSFHKKLARALFGDLVIKGFLVTARTDP